MALYFKNICLITALLLLAPYTAEADTPYRVNGTYTCLTDKNFGGFVARKSGDTSPNGIDDLMVSKFTAGSNQIICCGAISNSVLNFEMNTAQISTDIVPPSAIQNFNISYTTTAISNIYKVTIGAVSTNNFYYFSVVDSGSKLLIMSAPTTTSPSSGICHRL